MIRDHNGISMGREPRHLQRSRPQLGTAPFVARAYPTCAH
jgi:hypothetical protein